MLETVVKILNASKKPILKHPLMCACNLSSLTFKKYVIDLLLPCGLLDAYPAVNLRIPGRKTRHRMFYQTSQKGKKLLKHFREIEKLLS